MKTQLIFILTLFFGTNVFSQTMFLDYTERTKENTGTIHLVESKLPIEKEDFTDISTAKVKLIRTIENYRADGYTVRATSVTTHTHKRSLHYHYQYILQKTTHLDSFINELDDAEAPVQMRKKKQGKQTQQQPLKPVSPQPEKVDM